MALAGIIFSPAFADREADASAAKTSLIVSQASGYGITSLPASKRRKASSSDARAGDVTVTFGQRLVA
jgi:hypothetical protein